MQLRHCITAGKATSKLACLMNGSSKGMFEENYLVFCSNRSRVSDGFVCVEIMHFLPIFHSFILFGTDNLNDF